MNQGTYKRNITLKEIAKSLGVSISTVSKALHDDPAIRPETKALVKLKADEMGYLPNDIARDLRYNSSKTIGIILNDIENPTRTHIVKRITVDLSKHGYICLIFDSLYDQEIERRNISALLSRRPEAIVLSPVSTATVNLALLKGMFGQTIVLSQIFNDIETNYVHVDHCRGGYISASTLLRHGHSKNVIFVEPTGHPSAEQFLSGVDIAYSEYGLKLDPSTVVRGVPSVEVGYHGFIEQSNRFANDSKVKSSGVICACDLYAFGVYRAAQELGLRIPDDVSVIGYDDNPLARLLTPPLTTLQMPIEVIGEYCSKILVSMLIHGESRKNIYNLVPLLIERSSIIPYQRKT